MLWCEATRTTTLPNGSHNRKKKRGLQASCGQGARLGNKANKCELLKLSLHVKESKMLIGSALNWAVRGYRAVCTRYADKISPVERQSLNCPLVTQGEHSKPVFSPGQLGRGARKSFLEEVQVRESGESECLFVMRGIKVEI